MPLEKASPSTAPLAGAKSEGKGPDTRPRVGFRGTAENAKTRICQRCACPGACVSCMRSFLWEPSSGKVDALPRMTSWRGLLCSRCRWQAGHCRFGDRCNFAHGEEELRALPPKGNSGGGRGRGRGGEGSNSGGGGGGGRGQVSSPGAGFWQCRLCCWPVQGCRPAALGKPPHNAALVPTSAGWRLWTGRRPRQRAVQGRR